MSEMRRLAAELSREVRRAPGFVHGFLHMAGFRGSVAGALEVVAGIADHVSDFEYLARTYPACSAWVEVLSVAPELLGGLRRIVGRPGAWSTKSWGTLKEAVGAPYRAADNAATAGGSTRISRPNFAPFVQFVLPEVDGSLRPASRVLRAGVFLVGVMRQASHEGAAEEGEPVSWMNSIVKSADMLSTVTLDWPCAESAGQPDIFEAAMSALKADSNCGEAGSRLATDLEKLRRLFRSKGAAALGRDVEQFFVSIGKESLPAVAAPVVDRSGDAPSAGDESSAEDDGIDEDEADPDEIEVDIDSLDDDDDDVDDGDGDLGDMSGAGPGQDVNDAAGDQPPRGPWPWGHKPSSVLPERMLLPEHTWAFDPAELAELSSIVESSLTQPERISPGSRPVRGGLYEAIVAGIALALAQTLEGACAFRLIRACADPMLETARELPRSRYLSLDNWNADASPGASLSFPPGDRFRRVPELNDLCRLDLPASLSARIQQMSGNSIDAELEELLPFVPGGWANRTHTWLNAKFGRAAGHTNLAIKHALSRELYAATASRALLDLACGGPSKKDKAGLRHVALSAYVHPANDRNPAEFLHAVTRLVSPSLLVPECLGRPSCRYIAQDTLAHISTKLRAAAEQSWPTRLAAHNAIAIYTLSMLHAATGHRHSLRPFHFPWDLELEAMIVFICDKRMVGSEARFVPVARAMAEQLLVYRRHLAGLILELQRSRPDLARRIASSAGIAYQGDRADTSVSGSHPVSQFFTIRGDVLLSIESKDIDAAMRAALSDLPWAEPTLTDSKRQRSIVRLLRKNLATYLWTAGASGVQVEALLGHNRDWHIHGKASTWTVLGDVSRVRPIIDQYLADTGWVPIDEKALGKLNAVPPMVVPLAVLGVHGYEGRERAADQAYARARAAVRDELIDELDGRQETVVLGDADIDRIRAAVVESLGNDRRAKDKILQVFSSLSGKWRQGGMFRISAKQVNRVRSEAGPVEVGFARDLAIANAIRAEWPKAVAEAIEGANSKRQDMESVRLAVILSALIVQDGILDPNQLWPLIESLHAREARNAKGRVQIRAEVETRSAIFDRVAYLTRLTSAVVRGLHETTKEHRSAGLDRSLIEEILSEIVSGIVPTASKKGWTMTELARVFRAWWFVRLPGFLYAAAIGEVAAPSADEITEATLLGSEPPTLRRLNAQRTRQSKAPREQQEAAANEAVEKLFKEAAGKHVDADQASRTQRQELRKLFALGLPEPLPALMSEHAILDVRVRFIEYLLVSGGRVKEHLAFNTIRGYDGRLKDLYHMCWDRDPSEMSGEEIDEVYGTLIETSKDEALEGKSKARGSAAPVLLMTALRSFHFFLRTTYGVAPSTIVRLPLGACRQSRARSALLAPRLTGTVLASVRRATKDRPALGNGASTAVLTGQAFGTRRKEALCVMVRDFDLAGNHLRLRIRSNPANKLKNTRAGRRVIPWPFAKKQHVQLLRSAVQSEALTAQTERYLLADPSGVHVLMDDVSMMSLVNATLKSESGNAAMVYHGLRHGFATGALCAVSSAVGDVRPCISIRAEMTPGAEVAEEVAVLRPNREQWPFFAARAAMWHGAGVETVLNVYFHGAGWMLAEHADACAEDHDINVGVWATLMGMTRTNPTKVKAGWKRSEGEGADTSWERIVRHFIEALKLPAAGELDVVNAEGATLLDDDSGTDSFRALTFAMADKLLVRMRREGLTVDQVVNKARDEHSLDPELVRRFLKAKKQVIDDTNFLAFEHQEIDGHVQTRASREGVWRNSVRRQAFLTRLEVLALDDRWRASLSQMADEWQRWVNSRQPMLVVTSEQRLLDVLDLLENARVAPEHMSVMATASIPAAEIFTKSWAEKYAVSRELQSRFSRGDRTQQVQEFGILLKDTAPSLALRNADLHRAMITVAASLAALSS